jgi:hypothetical protein
MRFWAWAESMPADYGEAAASGKTRVARPTQFPLLPACLCGHGIAAMPRNDRRFSPEILYLAKRYLRWQTLAETLECPLRLVAAVMDQGSGEECALIRKSFGPALMRQALQQAARGWFHPASWDYWHHQLGLVPPGAHPPAPPVRTRRAAGQAARPRRALSTSSITT